MAIKFYKEFGELGYLATYSNHGFYKDGVFYQTSEHYYQSKKFVEKEVVDKIIHAKTPKEASNIGRDRNNPLRKNWNQIKNLVMFDAVYYKFSQHEDLKEKLLATGEEEIIEETTKENYWGCGPNYDGSNHYGKILCKVREQLRSEKQMSKYYVTRERYENLYQEISQMDKLHDEVERKMGESVKRDNDLRENPEYMSLRVEAMYGIPARKKELLLKYQNAIIIEDTEEYLNWDQKTIIRKCNVELLVDGIEEKYTILGSDEGVLENSILSCDAPFVKSILGHKVGEAVLFNGMVIEIKNVSKVEEKVLEKKHDEK